MFLLLIGQKCQAGWSEWGGEVQPQLPQRIVQASVCVINHSETLRRGTIHFYPSSHPSILSPSFIIECVSSEHPICHSARSKREGRKRSLGVVGCRVKPIREEGRVRKHDKMRTEGRGGEKMTPASSLITHRWKCLKAKVTGSFMCWIMDLLYFLVVSLLVDNSWFNVYVCNVL